MKNPISAHMSPILPIESVPYMTRLIKWNNLFGGPPLGMLVISLLIFIISGQKSDFNV